MNIIITDHARLQTKNRIKKLEYDEQIDKYLKDKFNKMLDNSFINDRWISKICQWQWWSLKLINRLHNFVYKREWDTYIIITYYLNNNYLLNN